MQSIAAPTRVVQEKDLAERKLEQLVFGTGADFLDSLSEDEFGDHDENAIAIGQSDSADESVDDLGALEDSQLFFLDAGSDPSKDVIGAVHANLDGNESADIDVPKWVDSEDERIVVSLASNSRLRKLRIEESDDLVNGVEYTKRLRRQYENLHPPPRWARKIDDDAMDDDSSDLLSDGAKSDDADDASSVEEEVFSAPPLASMLEIPSDARQKDLESFKSGNPRRINPKEIDIFRLKDVGSRQPSRITSLSFHPRLSILLIAGSSGLLSLHHIVPNDKGSHSPIFALHVRSTAITEAYISPSAENQVVFAGRRRYYHAWDLDSGKVNKISRVFSQTVAQRSMESFKISPDAQYIAFIGSSRKGGGSVNIVDRRSNLWVTEARVEGIGGAVDLAWWADSTGLAVVGKGGEVVEYSVQYKRVVARWIDDGAVGTTTIALSGSKTISGPPSLGRDAWLAVGSSSGIVNLYDRRQWKNVESVPARPQPAKILKQLTTPISCLSFSPDGQLLCMASRWKRDALRLIHLPTCNVYPNWPTSNTPLGRVTAIAWSANSSVLVTGNEQGKTRLWKVKEQI